MREIKFRAWDKLRNKMLHFTQSPEVISEYNVLTWEVDEKEEKEYYGALQLKEGHMELMQYTGLKDKNGKEIYEGDLLKYLAHYPSDFQERHPRKKFGRVAGPVQWIKGWLYLDYDGESADNTLLYEEEAKSWEIIGNIYENPNLIS